MAEEIIQLNWSGATHVGRVRKNNEDAFLALTFDRHGVRYLGKEGSASVEIGDFVFAVSDGMGGENAGEFASRIAVNKITQLLPRSFRMAAAGLRTGGHDLLSEVFSLTHREMQSMSFHYEECCGMGATLSLCWFTPERAFFAHIGDSRIYYLPREGGIKQISHDHTHVGWLVRTGKITESAARFHPQKNLLSKALGARFNENEPQLGTIEYERGDRLLLCTDGIMDACGANGLDELIRNPGPLVADKSPAFRIVDEAVSSAGRDNCTAVVIEVG